jgi:DNA-binding response OmpR family regulator
VEILIATDASWVVDDITAALGADGVNFTVCSEGRVVADEVEKNAPDLAILDMQIGSMGGMAVTMSLRLDESSGLLPHVPVLMLLDRRADLHLARRSGAEGWLIKPLDSLRLKRAVTALDDGGTYTEGLPVPDPVAVDEVDADADVAESSEEEAVNAG